MKAFVQFGDEADTLPELPVVLGMDADLDVDDDVDALLAGSVD